MILLRPPWTRQPPYPARIDRANPLALGLVSLILPGQSRRDIAGQIDLSSTSGSVSTSLTGDGYALRLDGNQEAIYTTASPAMQALSAQGSILWVGTLLGAPSGSAALGGITANNTNALPYVLLEIKRTPSTADTIYLNYSVSSTVYQNVISTGTYTSGAVIVVGTFVSGSQRLYIRSASGVERITGTDSGALYSTSTARIEVGDSLNGRNPNAACAMQAIASRAWTEDECKQLLENPWQLFAPFERRIWVPSAGGSYTHPALSNARMGSLTSTGGVPTADYAF